MLQVAFPLSILFLLVSCGGGSGTSLDDLNSNTSSPIVLRSLSFSVDEDTTLTETITYQNESLVQVDPTVGITVQTEHGLIELIDALAGTFSVSAN